MVIFRFLAALAVVLWMIVFAFPAGTVIVHGAHLSSGTTRQYFYLIAGK